MGRCIKHDVDNVDMWYDCEGCLNDSVGINPRQKNTEVSHFLKAVQMDTENSKCRETPILELIVLLRNPQTNGFYRVVFDYANSRYGSQLYSGNNYHDKYWWYKNRMEHLCDDTDDKFCPSNKLVRNM